MTTGDNYNCKCPFCGKVNHYITQGQNIPFEQKVFTFSKECTYCKEKIFYSVNWEITVEAEREFD